MGGALSLCAVVLPALPAIPVQAATSRGCEGGDFRVVLPGGRALSGYTGFKIAAKDVAPGGTVQVRGQNTTITHTLASGIFYFKNPYTGKINFGNGAVLRGKDSPQSATRLSQDGSVSVWSVASGGRMGMVLGEDAVELSAGAAPCTADCQAQERIRGSLPVADPFFAA